MHYNGNPKVSFICAVWNVEETLEKHLKSLIDQDYKNKEIIIVDDGSKDKTQEIAKKFSKKYKFVKYYRLKHLPGYGCVRPRIEAINHARGEIYCIVDADGYYEKWFLTNGVKILLQNEKTAAVFPNMHAWEPKNFMSKYRALMYEIRFNDAKLIEKLASEGKCNPIILKKESYKKAGGYNIKDSYSEDIRLAERILKKGHKIVYEPTCDWYHKIGGTLLWFIEKNYNIGLMHSKKRIFTKYELVKTIYFISPIVILVSGFFINKLWYLLLAHLIIPMIQSIKLFIKAKTLKYRNYALIGFLVSYIVNIPHGVGLLIGLLKPKNL